MVVFDIISADEWVFVLGFKFVKASEISFESSAG